VEAFQKTFLLATGRSTPEWLQLSTDDDWTQVEFFTLSIQALIKQFNQYYNERQFSAAQDSILGTMKEFCTLCRTWWMKGGSREEFPSEFARLAFGLMHYTEGNAGEGETITQISNSSGVYRINTKVICTFGNMARALSVCSTEELIKNEFQVYNRFRVPRPLDEELKGSLKDWTRNFFSPLLKMKNEVPDIQKDQDISCSLGFQLSTSACIERQRKDGGILGLVADHYKLVPHPILINKTFTERIDYQAKFTWQLATEILADELAHAPDCSGQGCIRTELHLPLIPIGIKESGGRSRIPCLTSGIANSLGHHVRQKLFRIIKTDPRTAFRYGGRKNHFYQMMKSLKDDEVFHSSDLKSSTDFFSFDLARTISDTLRDMGLITRTEHQAMCLLTGSFRMGIPTEENVREQHLACVPDVREEIERCTVRGSYGMSTILSQTGPMKAFLTKFSQRAKQGTRVFDPVLYPPRASFMRERMIELTRQSIRRKMRGEYLTQCGLHMSTSVSIAFLNCMNLFADTMANEQTRFIAKTLITGDDALRAAIRSNIEAYKQMITRLQGVFSETKDVVTNEPRVLYTEILLENGQFVDAPMPKIVVRPEPQLHEAPAWLTALNLLSSIIARPLDKTNMINMILDKYQATWLKAKYLPIFDILSIEHNMALRPLSERVQDIMSIKDPWHAVQMYHYYTSLLRVIPRERKGLGFSSMHLAPIPEKIRYIGYHPSVWEQGALWLKLAVRKLQALTEVAQALEKPTWSVGHQNYSFEYLDNHQTTLNEYIDWSAHEKLPQPRSIRQFREECMEIDVDITSILPVHLQNLVD